MIVKILMRDLESLSSSLMFSFMLIPWFIYYCMIYYKLQPGEAGLFLLKQKNDREMSCVFISYLCGGDFYN